VGKPEYMTPLRKHRHMWEDKIKLDPRETGWGGMYWIHLAQYRDQWGAFVNMVMSLWVP
jgi:hypothetical protein